MSSISLGAFHAVGITNFTPYNSSAGLNPVPADFIVLMTRSVFHRRSTCPLLCGLYAVVGVCFSCNHS
ncbi:hypothetical protein AYI70_g9061 [Smittium culicis]|uniref:Uncharacterized protein n=2 Tax=Smittium culicis TaxID=133412 RepID=A0A1R1XD43_9FUNG|nr:hypothetical protein AYI69_g11169 [Smittium culicis]OMJ12528.1 hypothetical protein AYI70_g9059 [Smittium culicis]OMJ12530.1 hypothetical protein AYI70_g9061 [Smittium culicis]